MSRRSILGLLPALAIAALGAGAPTAAWALDGALALPDETDEHPNVCAVIGVPAPGSGNPLRMGSGVLIAPRVVLTAGHVTDWFATIWDVPPERTRISFALNAFDDTKWLEVSDYVTHPLYNGYFGALGHADTHDLGVVILKEPVVGVAPTTLPPEGLLDMLKVDGSLPFGADHGKQMTVVGYGWGYSFPPPTPLQPRRGIRRYGPTICMGMMPASLHFLLDPEGTVPQNGDSGGPTFWKSDSGELVVVALTTWGAPGPGVGHRYRVDTSDSLDFIDGAVAAVNAGLF